jgi:porphobilinogen synthase
MYRKEPAPRRLRKTPTLRSLVRETRLTGAELIMPYFVIEGRGIKREIPSLPGIYQHSIDLLIPELKELSTRGINAIILFGIPQHKDELGTQAYAADGVIQRAVTQIKDNLPELIVVTDVCLCEYTEHGHCGVIKSSGDSWGIDTPRTLDLIARTAISQVKAGADIVAPSGMMDGAVGAIRAALDGEGFKEIPIMGYSAKYCSSFYGPFREAAQSAPKFGDRTTYQMDIANAQEALREIELDIREGADIVMVKPALAYLDIIKQAKQRFDHPLAAFSVSGEYAAIKAASIHGWLDERRAALEILTSIKRAGADIILTYWAKEALLWKESLI